jgi:glyoxylase-like metal-dependent hydrolase (beta-lactamase superfamily II)
MAHGIHTIDTGFVRPHFDAAYLLVENARAAFIDCGTNHAVPNMLKALDAAGLAPANVDWLILTHVHLDHAGGAGELIAQLPNARLVVHPRGARHMIDPSQLWAGASAVYGEEVMEATYGRLRAIPAERVVEAPDGHVVSLSGRPLLCLDTPGHARHHLSVYDERARVCFTGDTFGLSYRELDTARGPFIVPTTSPVQFDPEALHTSINRLIALQPLAMYLTHYDRVEGVEKLAEDLHAQIDAMVSIARSAGDASTDAAQRHEAMKTALTELYLTRAQAHGWSGDRAQLLEILGMDVELNAQGLGIWLDQQRRSN